MPTMKTELNCFGEDLSFGLQLTAVRPCVRLFQSAYVQLHCVPIVLLHVNPAIQEQNLVLLNELWDQHLYDDGARKERHQ